MIRIFLTLLFMLTPAFAAHIQLAPYKDALFAYPAVLEEALGGRYLRVAYDKQRDIYARDTVPRRKARREYISGKPRWSRRPRTYEAAGRTLKMFKVGNEKSPSVTVIYLYGKGGNRSQGVQDGTFGGNFNRLQNLMVRNDGLLLSPDYTNFSDGGFADIANLVAARKSTAPGSPIILACGSMGGFVCWQLAHNAQTSSLIDGYFLLGSYPSDTFVGSPAFQARVPVYIGHGTSDVTSPVEGQVAFHRSILAAAADYPARMVAFETGVHGTPIRMVDWRRELNWMLARHR